MANELYTLLNDSYLDSAGFNYRGVCIVGNWGGDSTNGALRFGNLAISKNQTIIEAYLIFKYDSVGSSGTWKFILYGIDEDNTADFSSYPLGRTKTTANNSYSEGEPTTGGSKTMNVKAILEEITSREGWSSGNNIGFILDNNSSDNDVYASADNFESYLVYKVVSDPNFFPTPGTVAAPTFPASSSYGLKVSRPGVDVGTASESDLWFTTDKKVFKVLNEGTADISSGTATYVHNLGYNPVVLGYIKGTATGETRMYKLNKIFSPFEDTDAGGYILSGTATTKVYESGLGTTGFVYIYTFIDPLN